MTELPDYNPELEEFLQVSVNGCFINQALFSLHTENLIHITIENNKTTVDTVALLIGNKLEADFEKGS